VYVWDVGDPAHPTLTDSVLVDAKTVARIAVNAAGTVAALTREGAESRRNGVVLLDLADPAHPRVAGEYWETILGGARDLAWDGELLYVADAGTDNLVILDASNPRDVREAGRWAMPAGQEGELFGVAARDGMAYLAFGDAGMVALDVGKGSRDGTPRRPRYVGMFRYQPSWSGRPAVTTHSVEAFTGTDGEQYVFVADAIIPRDAVELGRRAETGGVVHVVTLSSSGMPQEVATYTVRGSGVHDLHADSSTLYVAALGGGVHAVDVSGRLRGRLEGRENASFAMGDERTRVAGVPYAWGVRAHGGHVFATDANSGLWIARRR
jgi:hypothetical protein